MRRDVVLELDDSNQLSINDYQDIIYHSIAERRGRRRRGGGGEGTERGDEEGEEGREVVTMVMANGHTPRKVCPVINCCILYSRCFLRWTHSKINIRG